MSKVFLSILRKMTVTALGLVLLCLVACGTSKTIMLNSVSPLQLRGEESLRLVAVSDIVSDMPMDEKIGHGHQGLINLVNDTYYASKISEAHSLILTALEEELHETGYRIHKKNRSLFSTAADTIKEIELLIGGRIVGCKFDSYSSIGGKKSTAEATVLWQLFDRREDTIVFEKQTSGSAKGPAKSVSSLAFAVRASFREVLSDEKFVNSVRTKLSQKWPN